MGNKSALGKKSAVAKTTFNAQTMRWRVLRNSPVASSRTDDIWFFDENTGWLVNSSGYVCKTTDGGECWEPKFYLCPSSKGKPYLRCLGWGSDQSGWFGSVTGIGDEAHNDPTKYLDTLLHHTTDGGETWRPITNLPRNTPAGICGFYAVNENVVYGAGTNDPGLPGPGVIKTTNGGASWQLIKMCDLADNLIDIFFFDEKEGFVVGGKNHACEPLNPGAYPPPRLSKYAHLKPVVLHTTDGGESWTNVAANVEGLECGEWGWKIQFVDRQVGFISLENFARAAILKTTNGGKTWTRHAVQDACGKSINKDLEGIGFINENQGWVGGWGNNFAGNMNCYTEDGGLTWQSQDHNSAVLNSDDRVRINRYRFVKRDGQLIAGYCSGQQVYKLDINCKKAAFANDESKKKAFAATPRLEPACSGHTSAPMQSAMPGRQLAHSHDYQLECKPLEDGKMAISFSLPKGVNTVYAGLWNQFAFYVKTLINGKPQGEADENGRYTLVWDGRDESGNQAGSGVFICRLSVDGREGSSQNLTYSTA